MYIKGVNVEALPFDALPCQLSDFVIDNTKADIDDFVDVYEHEICYCYDPCYGCHNMRAEPVDDNMDKAIDKYDITKEQFYAIQDHLIDLLSVGPCGWCS